MKDMLYEIKGLVPESVVFSLHKELTITEDMDREVDTAARIFGYYAILAEKAETRQDKMKFAFETWRAEVEAREAQDRESSGQKSLTVERMKAFVRSQPKYKAFQLKIIEFSEHARILKVIAKSFEMKAELIRTKCSNRRGESKGIDKS